MIIITNLFSSVFYVIVRLVQYAFDLKKREIWQKRLKYEMSFNLKVLNYRNALVFFLDDVIVYKDIALYLKILLSK